MRHLYHTKVWGYNGLVDRVMCRVIRSDWVVIIILLGMAVWVWLG